MQHAAFSRNDKNTLSLHTNDVSMGCPDSSNVWLSNGLKPDRQQQQYGGDRNQASCHGFVQFFVVHRFEPAFELKVVPVQYQEQKQIASRHRPMVDGVTEYGFVYGSFDPAKHQQAQYKQNDEPNHFQHKRTPFCQSSSPPFPLSLNMPPSTLYNDEKQQ
jgi:5-methylcytosine-specific restriction endonuclease McrA